MSYSRFKGASWFPKVNALPVSIIGLGGIGSWASLAIARAGFFVRLFDYDIVELSNTSGQFYPDSFVGRTKVNATTELLHSFTDTYILGGRTYRVNEDSTLDNITVCAVDNFEARRSAVNAWYNSVSARVMTNDTISDKPQLFIDARLEAEFFEIYVIEHNSTSFAEFNKTLVDENFQAATCSYKQTTHVAMTLAGMITGNLINYIDNFYAGKEDSNRRVIKYGLYNAMYQKMIFREELKQEHYVNN